MAIAPEAVERFLRRELRRAPPVKGASPEQLLRRIERFTGARPIAFQKSPPRQGQLEGLAFALEMGRGILGYDMRLGKTLIALEWAAHLQRMGLAEKKGIICTSRPILLDTWQTQSKRFTDRKAAIITSEEKEALFDVLDDDRVDLVLLSTSTLQTMFTVKAPPERGKRRTKAKPPALLADQEALEVLGQCFDLAIIDELHDFSNPESLRYRMVEHVLEGGQIPWRLGLTGTLHGKDKLTAWGPCYLIDEGEALGRNLYFFRSVFGKRHGYKNKALKLDPKREGNFQAALDSLMLPWKRTELEACVQTGTIELHMSGDQREAYNEVLEAQIARREAPDKHETENFYIKMRQISSGFTTFRRPDGTEAVHRLSSAKHRWLENFVAELTPDVPCVFFHDFTETGKWMLEIAKAAGLRIGWLYGGTQGGSKAKSQIQRDFQEGRLDHLICNAATGGVGIDLSRADYQIFFEMPRGVITRAQAEKRAMGDARKGRPLFIDDMVCSPVERKALRDMQAGKDTVAELFLGGKRGLFDLRVDDD